VLAIMRSHIAFACGAPGGLVRIRMPSAAKTASNALVKPATASHNATGPEHVIGQRISPCLLTVRWGN